MRGMRFAGSSVHATDRPRPVPNLDEQVRTLPFHGDSERSRVRRALDVLSGANATVAIKEVEAIQCHRRAQKENPLVNSRHNRPAAALAQRLWPFADRSRWRCGPLSYQ